MANVNDILAATAPLANLGGSALTLASNGNINKKNRKFYREERLATQEYNTAERIASQMYNYNMWRENNAYNEDIYNRYQSPEAMKRQYLAAGLNPALALEGSSNGSIGSVASQAAPSSPQSSAPIQASGAAYPYLPADSFTSGFVNIAQALKAIGDARKAGVETQRIEQFMSEELKKLKLSNDAQELANTMNAVKYNYLDTKERAEVNKVLQEISNGQLQGEELRKQIELLAKKNLIAKNEVDTWYKRFNVEQSNIEADTNLKGAQAGEASASAAVKWDEHSMRDLKAELLRQTANNQYSQSRLNYASERVAEITADMNELLREAQEFKGERSKANPAWRRLSAYGRSLVESWVSNAQILGIKGLGDTRNLAENPFNADGHLGSAYKLLLNLQTVVNGNSEASYNDARDIHNKYD